jgi:hypothetical protein
VSRPLWEVMAAAWTHGLGFIPCRRERGYAAEIRALADIIEQRGAQGLDHNPGETADWLRAEAERAEGQA